MPVSARAISTGRGWPFWPPPPWPSSKRDMPCSCCDPRTILRRMSVPRPRWLLALLVMACGGGSTGPSPVDQPILVVGLARLDQSTGQTLTGYLALFYDVDRDSLLTAQVRVNA